MSSFTNQSPPIKEIIFPAVFATGLKAIGQFTGRKVEILNKLNLNESYPKLAGYATAVYGAVRITDFVLNYFDSLKDNLSAKKFNLLRAVTPLAVGAAICGIASRKELIQPNHGLLYIGLAAIIQLNKVYLTSTSNKEENGELPDGDETTPNELISYLKNNLAMIKENPLFQKSIFKRLEKDQFCAELLTNEEFRNLLQDHKLLGIFLKSENFLEVFKEDKDLIKKLTQTDDDSLRKLLEEKNLIESNDTQE